MNMGVKLMQAASERIANMQSAMTVEVAEHFGYDAGKNGANATNANFAIFCKPEFTAAWERGKKRAADESRR